MLTELPPELLFMIAEFAGPSTCLKVRLLSKVLANNFTTTAFRIIVHRLTSEGVDKLKNIALRSDLAGAIRELTIHVPAKHYTNLGSECQRPLKASCKTVSSYITTLVRILRTFTGVRTLVYIGDGASVQGTLTDQDALERGMWTSFWLSKLADAAGKAKIKPHSLRIDGTCAMDSRYDMQRGRKAIDVRSLVHLDICFNEREPNQHAPRATTRILRRAVNLRTLRLRSIRADLPGESIAELDKLHFPALRRLAMDELRVDCSSLKAFLSSHTQLSSVDLLRVKVITYRTLDQMRQLFLDDFERIKRNSETQGVWTHSARPSRDNAFVLDAFVPYIGQDVRNRSNPWMD